jgi:S1-C subfamily serine protease
MASTRRNEPGDTVEVVILRGGEELKLEVTLAGAR